MVQKYLEIHRDLYVNGLQQIECPLKKLISILKWARHTIYIYIHTYLYHI